LLTFGTRFSECFFRGVWGELFEDLGAIFEGFGKVFGGHFRGHVRTLEYVFGLHRHAQNACGPLPREVKFPHLFEICSDPHFGHHFWRILDNLEVIWESHLDHLAIIFGFVF